MKYVISDEDEVNIGHGYHFELAENFTGKVIAAGHCKLNDDGKTYTVYGRSIGYGISAKEEDAEMLEGFEEKCERCGGDGYIEIMGDGENFEWDVVDTKPCPECTID